jgi:hypothetical protein
MRRLTQFGRALTALTIEIICANSSQAKGRVVRANETLQDCLVKELRLAGVNAWKTATPSCRPSWRTTTPLRQGTVQRQGSTPAYDAQGSSREGSGRLCAVEGLRARPLPSLIRW